MANHNVHGVQVHGADANYEVSTGQAEQEVVVDCLQVPVYLKRNNTVQAVRRFCTLCCVFLAVNSNVSLSADQLS